MKLKGWAGGCLLSIRNVVEIAVISDLGQVQRSMVARLHEDIFGYKWDFKTKDLIK